MVLAEAALLKRIGLCVTRSFKLRKFCMFLADLVDIDVLKEVEVAMLIISVTMAGCSSLAFLRSSRPSALRP